MSLICRNYTEEKDSYRVPVFGGNMILIGYEAQKNIASIGEKNQGLNCGIPAINTAIRGLRGGNLILIAGRASMGKTSLMMDMALYIGKIDPCLVISLEMPFDELQQRSLCNIARLNFHRIMSGTIEPDERADLEKAVKQLDSRKVYVVDGTWKLYPDWFKDKQTGTLPNDSLKALIVNAIKEKGVKTIFIDHLQFIRTELCKADNESLRLHEITQALHEITIEYDVPIILLSQLRRLDPERKKIDPRPTLDDIRNSGQVEENANIVCLLHRPEYYRSKQEIDMFTNKVENDAEIIIAKNRGGPTGTLSTVFNAFCMSFSEKGAPNDF